MNYDYADKAIRDMNRKNLRLFKRLRTLKFDELNVLSAVDKVFKESYKYALHWYLLIIKKIYKKLDEDWLLDMLEEDDPVTLYIFGNEIERKKQRLTEAILSAVKKQKEIDKGLRLWTLQLSHYAEKCVDKATIQKYKDEGVEQVMWMTEKDEKVCSICAARDGKIYPIDEIPPKPHYHCRCWFMSV